MWIVKTDQIFAIHSTNQSIQQSSCSHYYNLDKRNDFVRNSTLICILNLLSMIHWLGALSILKNTAFHSNIEMWMNDWYYQLLQLSRIKHIWFESMMIKLIIPWFVTHWYINKWMIDCWIDRMVNPAWFPIQSNSIGFDPILV